MFSIQEEKKKESVTDERCWRKKTAGGDTLSKSFQSLFRLRH